GSTTSNNWHSSAPTISLRCNHQPPVTTSPCGATSRAAIRAAAAQGLTFAGADERTGELVLDERSHPIDVNTRLSEVASRILELVDAPRLELHIDESGRAQLPFVLHVFERARKAADPEFHAATNVGRHLPSHHDIGDRKAPTRFEDSERFTE